MPFQFKLQVQPNGGSEFDDTALNSICLLCNNNRQICSKLGFWGNWGESSSCSQGFGGADFQLEPDQGRGDDAMGNNLALYCNPSGTEHKVSGISIPGWGDWLGRKNCKTGTVFCGIQTRVQDKSGGVYDETGLTGVRLQCCAKVTSVTVRLNPVFETEGSPGHDYLVEHTPTFSFGLLSSGPFDKSTCFQIVDTVRASVSFSEAAASASSGTSVSSSSVSTAFSLALIARDKQTTTTSWQVKASDHLYLYQGLATIHMSDGSTFKMGGDYLVSSSQKLSTSSYTVV